MATPVLTRTVTFTLIEPHILVQRYGLVDSGPDDIAEVAATRDRILHEHAPCGLMIVVPDGLPLRSDLMGQDHYRALRERGDIRALAMVADNDELLTAMRLYLIYHQQPFPTAAFDEERDAMRWLRQHVEGLQ